MDSSIPGIPNSPLPNTAVFADNVQDLLNAGALQVNPSAIIIVNSTKDSVDELNSGVTTLRDAISQANADEGEDLIVFDRSLFSTAQTITLNLRELDITHSLDIIAPRDTLTGGDLVTVSGNQASRVLEIGTGADVNIDGLIVADGKVTGNGGGILNSGILTLDHSIVRNNSLTVANSGPPGFIYIDGNGGGIYNSGILSLRNSTISGNKTGGGYRAGTGGAGIYNTSNLEVSNSTISNNSCEQGTFGYGGGIYTSGNSTVSNSTISGNSAFGGGGIENRSTLEVSNSTISGNSASDGGGISNSGNLSLSNSTLLDNKGSPSFIAGGSVRGIGGGIYNYNKSSTMNVSNSTISGNSATVGGGIYNSSTMNVSNSTISGNSASGGDISYVSSGGGIYNGSSATLTLVFSTLTQNQATNGGGLSNITSYSFQTPGTVNVRNTIIASNLNTKNGVNPDVSGTFTSFGYNLIGDSTGSTGFDATGDVVGTSDKPIDPRLDTLNSNGGPTQTIALLPDSPAIGAADPIVLSTDPITDQRGLPRRAADSSADIGAYELS
ncbi:MAG: right-handed parallel beta-helix repeat-containing protein [Stigonema ocellatum SAG 48.90 = DSM 106950]|nr:right-handed parallel beta-helix repeat-containing protein [Stigonema ocellatum SAG 48.90 = DSM 106950]